jgi:methylthioribose-1-phosphate isomerase
MARPLRRAHTWRSPLDARLPLSPRQVKTHEKMAVAIRDMYVRGAGLIGAAAGYGMYLAALSAPQQSVDDFEQYVKAAGSALMATRPTAVNLEFAVSRQLAAMAQCATPSDRVEAAKATAAAIADEDAEFCKRLGEHGLAIIREIFAKKQAADGKDATVNILTHCNAGWLAFVDNGSATGPIYAAHDAGIPVHVYVDETRPRNQGASLTCWELGKHGVRHTLIADNVGGHLMQHGKVDMVITGADRVLATGDVCNKIGTYLKALAAQDNGVPMYVALPSSTFDWVKKDGVADIPIELRDAREVKYIQVLTPTPYTLHRAPYTLHPTPFRSSSAMRARSSTSRC